MKAANNFCPVADFTERSGISRYIDAVISMPEDSVVCVDISFGAKRSQLIEDLNMLNDLAINCANCHGNPKEMGCLIGSILLNNRISVSGTFRPVR